MPPRANQNLAHEDTQVVQPLHVPNAGVGGDSLNELILGLLLDATTAQQALPTQMIAHDAFLCDTWGVVPHTWGVTAPLPWVVPRAPHFMPYEWHTHFT